MALKEAARLLPTVAIPENAISEERLALRTEAAALHGQTDLSLDSDKLAAPHLTTAVSFSPNYDQYAVSSGYIEVYRAGDKEPFAKLPQHPHRTHRAVDFEFSHDGRYLAALHRIGELRPRYVRVWDLENRSLVLDVEISVSQVRFSSSIRPNTPPHLAVVSTESTVTMFPECDDERRVDHDFENSVRGADFSSTGTTVFVVGDFPSLEEWSFEDDTTVSISLEAAGGSVDCGSDLNTIAVDLQSGEIHILDLGNLTQSVAVLRGHTNGVHSLSLSPDGTLVTSSSWDGSTRLWDILGNRELKRLEDSRLRTGFSFDSKHFSCISEDRDVLVYRVARNNPKRVCVDQYHLPRRNDVAIHPTNPRIAVTATNGYVEFWDLHTGQIIKPLKTDRAFEARVSSDGTQMLTSGRHGLRLWKLSISEPGTDDETLSVSCTLERSLTEHDSYQMDCTADLERVAFVTPDKYVIIADTTSFEQQQVLTSETGFYKVALSPDGKRLATLTNEGWHLAVWNADTGERIEEIDSNIRATGIAFSPDNLWLAANGVKDRFLWRVTDWKQIFQAPSDGRFPGDVCFSPDSRLIAMPHDRNSLELIDRATFDPVILLTSSEPRDRETVAFSANGRQLISTRGTDFEVWDLIELRNQLRELSIDWND